MIEWKYIVEIGTFDGSWFHLGANNERALTECLLFFRDDDRFDTLKVDKTKTPWNGVDEDDL